MAAYLTRAAAFDTAARQIQDLPEETHDFPFTCRSRPPDAVSGVLGFLMFGLEISSVPVILPILEAELGSSFSGLQWIMNAYTSPARRC